MARDDIHAIRVGQAFERRDNVCDLSRLGNAICFWLNEGPFLDRQAPAATCADVLELAVDPVACRPDTAFWVYLRRKRVSCAKRNELSYARLDILRRHRL